MQTQNTTEPIRCQSPARCQNFGCGNSAAPGWECCDKNCGYERKKDLHALRNVLAGITSWNDAAWGIKYWPVEKLNYYLKQLS